MRVYKQMRGKSRSIGRRVGAALLSLVLMLGVVSGCVQEEKTQVQEKETITLWHYWDQRFGRQTLTEVVEEYNQSQDKVKVEIKYFPDEDFKKQLALSMADGEMPDLALVDSADLKYFYEMQELVDLSGMIEGCNEYFPEVKAASCVDGKMVGLPMGMNCAVLYCNVRLLKEQNLEVPKTWDDLCTTAKTLSEEGRYGRYGFAMPALPSEESVYAFLPFLWSGGGEIDQLDSVESMRAFSLLRNLSTSEAMSTETINLTSSDLTQQFIEGNVAMMINGTTVAKWIQKENPTLEFSISAPPVYDASQEPVTTLGGEILVALKGKHNKYAVDFIKYISDEKRMLECLEETGTLAPREDILEKQMEQSELARKIGAVVTYARPREFSVEWPYISIILTEAMGDTVVGKVEEEQILKQAAEEIRQVREDAQ